MESTGREGESLFVKKITEDAQHGVGFTLTVSSRDEVLWSSTNKLRIRLLLIPTLYILKTYSIILSCFKWHRHEITLYNTFPFSGRQSISVPCKVQWCRTSEKLELCWSLGTILIPRPTQCWSSNSSLGWFNNGLYLGALECVMSLNSLGSLSSSRQMVKAEHVWGVYCGILCYKIQLIFLWTLWRLCVYSRKFKVYVKWHEL